MRSARILARKNLIVEEEVRALKRVLGVSTDSEAVRIAIRDRLALEEAQAAFRHIRARGGMDDIFHHSASDCVNTRNDPNSCSPLNDFASP